VGQLLTVETRTLPPPFFPAFNNSIVAGKKGGLRDCEAVGLFPIFLATPSLLPGHYAIIKGREEGRGVERILKVTKKSGNRERDVGCCLYETVSRPPFFPAFNNSIVAGKKGGDPRKPLIQKVLLC